MRDAFGIAALTAGCFAVVLLTACNDDRTLSSNKPDKRQPLEHLVEVAQVRHEAVSTAHERSGTLRARRQVRIHSQEEGRINEMPYFEGDRVSRGDILVRLDDELLRAQLEKAVATSRLARINLDRLQDLVRKRAASEDERVRAETALEVALAEQKLLEARIRLTRIEAPIDGVISERHAEPGDVAAKHSHLLTLVDPGSLMTEIRVSELLLPQIGIGDSVSVRIDALGRDSHPGRIQRIHPALDPATRQGVVEVALDPVPEGARTGQFARVTLESARVRRMLVPFASVKRDRQGEYVFLLDADNRTLRAAVTTGIRIGDMIELLQGVEPGQRVVSRGFLGLAEGKLVTPVDTMNRES